MLVGISEHGRECRRYSRGEVGRGRGELWGVQTTEDQLFSPPSPSPSSSLASHQALAALLAVASQAEVGTGSWRLCRTSLGYRCSAGVEVGDGEPGVQRDLGEETVSPEGTAGPPTPPSSSPGHRGYVPNSKGIYSL